MTALPPPAPLSLDPAPEPSNKAAESAVPMPASVSAAPGPRHNMALWLGLFGVVALLATTLLWQKVSNMQEQLARQSGNAQALSQEARVLAQQALERAQQTAARAAIFDARLSEVALQRGQLDELMQSLSRSRDENLVVDIEAALRLAQQQAQLTGSVEPLLAALKSADQRVARAAQPRLALLQRALAHDIDRVKSSAVSDTPSMLLKLDELVRLSDELVLANAVAPARSVVEKGKAAHLPTANGWQKALQLVLEEVSKLVRVSRIEAPESVLLSPEQSFFVRENLKLQLLNARLGLLARQIDSARSDLAVAQGALTKYFDGNARTTKTAVALLRQVQLQMRTLELPRIDETLTVLATAAAGH